MEPIFNWPPGPQIRESPTNVRVHLKSTRSVENGNNFNARSIFVSSGSNRNVTERNSISFMVQDSYVSRTYVACGIRLDVDADYNIFQDNVIHDLDFAQAGR